MNNIDDLQLSMNSYDHQILKWYKEGMAMDKQWSDSERSAGLRRFLGSVSLHQKSTAPDETIVRVFKYSAKLELKLTFFLVLLFIAFANLSQV